MGCCLFCVFGLAVVLPRLCWGLLVCWFLVLIAFALYFVLLVGAGVVFLPAFYCNICSLPSLGMSYALD
jgi:hypothetical protein